MTRTDTARPVHLQWKFVGLVAAGGVAGALARYVLSLVIPAPHDFPLPTLAINLSGALALGALLEALARKGPDAGTRRSVRLAVGTGFLGAYTTYSTLALDAVHLLGAGAFPAAAWYLGLSLAGGAAATVAGIGLGALIHRRTQGRPALAEGKGRQDA